MISDELRKKLEIVVAQVDKQYGKGVIYVPGTARPEAEVISTGNIAVDVGLQVGGLPKGRIIEVYGPEHIGKTLLALTTVAQCQKNGGLAAYVDIEHAIDPIWAEYNGVIWDDLVFSQPDYGEQALDITEKLIKTNEFDLVVVDSVAALTPKAELEGSMEDNHMALQPRMMSQAMRKLVPVADKHKSMVLFLNQEREKIGYMQQGTTSSGGRALKYASSVRIQLRKLLDIKNAATGEILGTNVQAKILKNKFGRPMVTVEYQILHGKGFNNSGTILNMAIQRGLIKRSGSWYAFCDTGESFAQGEQSASRYLEDNLDIMEKLKQEIFNNAED